jgi:hypothetical protein
MRITRHHVLGALWFYGGVLALALLLSVVPREAVAEELQTREQLLAELLQTTQQLMHLEGKPAFVDMTTDQMKEDGCANPASEKCPMLVSVHPPGTDRIIVNTDVDLEDLSVQGQIVHVLAMYLVEQAGGYSPDMPCDRVMQIEARAQVVQAAFIDLRLQEYVRTGRSVPEFTKHQVWTFCVPVVKGEF